MNILDAQINYWNLGLSFCREVSCFITPETGLISITTNDAHGEVDFGWEKIWDTIKSNQEKCTKAIMIHTHPDGINQMSSKDINMVQGWRLALGMPIDFFIVCSSYHNNQKSMEISHDLCDRDDNKKIFIEKIKHEDIFEIPIGLSIMSEILYGISKEPNPIKKEDLMEIEKVIKSSKINKMFNQ